MKINLYKDERSARDDKAPDRDDKASDRDDKASEMKRDSQCITWIGERHE
jgi:hypothetical protein